MANPTWIFKQPEDMQKAWEGYKEGIPKEGSRWLKVQYVGKDGDRKADPQKVPYTLEGFKRYCRENHGEVEQYFKNQDDAYTAFLPICSRIREEIREDQITGGLLGFYNPSITQRLNSLHENINATVSPKLPEWFDESES